MFVCICNAIRETDLRETARRTGGDACSVYAALGKRPNCGQCLDDADMMIEEEREAARPVTIAA
ncbi:ferredoxin [Altererythrobacter sp. KTW20L]|uniref:(2Fe-2S)-binding protein n=1 Tax=Altererythrobacter sp. KTW20L TaxID=2942210 RepID=UPI0020C17D8E|nr:ferredoxin [Altererythrobacter sp. KTW20L]MCL6250917.1 ferredoxin [Altererythrobacter sp. KTW20L]